MTLLFIPIVLVLVAIDQVTKLWAADALANQTIIPVVESVFELRYAENRGVAFSMLQDQRWIFVPVSIAMAAVLVVMLMRSPMRKNGVFFSACTLVLSGAIGNLIDRIAYGYVIDFLYFRLIDFPIFNFADCCVVVGAFLLFGYFIFGLKDMGELPMRTLLFGIEKKQKVDRNG